jgi:hypothetical protein
MAGSLGSLVIELAANTARLQSDMGKAVNIVEAGARKIQGAFQLVAGGAVTAALGEMVSRAIEAGDNLNKAAIKAGVSGKAISELAYAAKQSDIDLTSLSTALKKMQVALSQAGSGAKEPVQALGALGLKIADLKALSPDKQFETLADRISRLTDPADRARAATELFGKAGADLLPLFEQGALGIQHAREEADRLGLSFGDEQLKKLSDADDAVKRLTASWDGFKQKIVEVAAGPLANVLDSLAGDYGRFVIQRTTQDLEAYVNRLQASQLTGGNTEGEQRSLALAVKELERRKKALNTTAASVFAPGASAVGNTSPGYGPDVPDTKQKVDEITEVVVTASRVRKDIWADYYKSLDDMTKTDVEKQISHLNEIEAAVQELVTGGKITPEEAAKRMAGAIDAALPEIEVTAKRLGDSLTSQFDRMTEFARQAARDMQAALADFLFDPFDKGLKGMLSGFIVIIRKILAEAASSKIFEALGGIGKKGSNPLLKGIGDFFGGFLAEGGPLQPGKWHIAGEFGPEPVWGGGAGAFAMGYGGGGGGVTNHFSIDARGADAGVDQRIRAAIAQAAPMIVDASRRQIKDDLSRRAIR